MNLNISAVNMMNSAFTFGLASIAFAVFPFLLMMTRALITAKQNKHNFSLINSLGLAYLVHCVSCISFIVLVKMLDLLRTIYGGNYLQDKVFPLFWARGKDQIFGLSGASGSDEELASFTALYVVQTALDLAVIILPFICLVATISYSIIHLSSNNGYRSDSNIMQTTIYIFTNVVAMSVLFIIWAKIASLALFMSNSDLLSQIQQSIKSLSETSQP